MPLLVRGFLVMLLLAVPARAELPELRHGSYVHVVVFSPDGKRLASASNDGFIRIWDPAERKEVQAFKAEKNEYPRALAYSPNGKLLASGSKDDVVYLREADSGKLLQRLESSQKVNEGAVHAVAFSPDGKLLASAGVGADVLIWDVAAGKELRRLTTGSKEIHALAFSPDGTAMVAAGPQSDFVQLWDPASGKPLRRSKRRHGGVAALTFAPDGKTLATTGTGAVRFWDLTSLEEIGRQPVRSDGSATGVYSLAFSFDGKYLATGSQDNAVRVFDLSTEQEVMSWKGLHGWIYSVAFAPDGRSVAIADHGFAVRLGDLTGAVKVPTVENLPALWRSLDDTDSARAHRAVWALAAAPDIAVPFLREQIAKLPAQKDHAGPLLKDLSSDNFATRQRAIRALENLGRAAEPSLRKALAGELPSLEMRRRIERILDKVDGPVADPDVLRAQRITSALERMPGPAGRKILESIAKASSDSWLGKEATASLARLVSKGKPEK
jgi:WD40 repeat protein